MGGVGAAPRESQGIDGGHFGGLEDGDERVAEAAAAHSGGEFDHVLAASLPHLDAAVGGATVQKAAVGVDDQCVHGITVRGDGFHAFQVGQAPHLDGLVPRPRVQHVLPHGQHGYGVVVVNP